MQPFNSMMSHDAKEVYHPFSARNAAVGARCLAQSGEMAQTSSQAYQQLITIAFALPRLPPMTAKTLHHVAGGIDDISGLTK